MGIITFTLKKIALKNKSSIYKNDKVLQDLHDEFLFLSPLFFKLLNLIIKRKFNIWWNYQKYTYLLYTVVFISLFIIIYLFTVNKNNNNNVSVQYIEIRNNNDSTVIIKDLINKDIKKYFDYIASTEVKYTKEDPAGYKTINEKSDAWGRYQMLKTTRSFFEKQGLQFSKNFFLSTPEFQDMLMFLYLKENDRQLTVNGVYKYSGKTIDGYYLTQCGLLSMSHAIGATGVKKFIQNNCDENSISKGAPGAYKRLTMQKYKIIF